MVGASGAAPGWHHLAGQQACSDPVPQALLSQGFSVLCDGSSSTLQNAAVCLMVFHAVPKAASIFEAQQTSWKGGVQSCQSR